MITDENTNGLQQSVEGSSTQSASYITIACEVESQSCISTVVLNNRDHFKPSASPQQHAYENMNGTTDSILASV